MKNNNERSRFVPREVLVRMEILSMAALTVVLMILSILRPAPLGVAPDPLQTPAHVSAPWIFAGIQELLRHFSTLIAGVVIPFALYLLFLFLPFFSKGRAEEGIETLKQRTGILLFFLLLLFCLAVPTLLQFIR